MDQFGVLEEKIDSFIRYIDSCKKEKEALLEKVRIQDERIANLLGELEELKSDRNSIKQKIVSLLEKIEQVSF